MTRRTLLGIIIYCGLFWFSLLYLAFGQSDTTVVTGTILKPDGKTPAVGAVVYVLKSIQSGTVLTSQTVEYKSGAGGAIRMVVPRNSVTYFYAPLIPELNSARGVPLTVPDNPTATFAELVPAQSIPTGYFVPGPQHDTSASAYWHSDPRRPAPGVWNLYAGDSLTMITSDAAYHCNAFNSDGSMRRDLHVYGPVVYDTLISDFTCTGSFSGTMIYHHGSWPAPPTNPDWIGSIVGNVSFVNGGTTIIDGDVVGSIIGDVVTLEVAGDVRGSFNGGFSTIVGGRFSLVSATMMNVTVYPNTILRYAHNSNVHGIIAPRLIIGSLTGGGVIYNTTMTNSELETSNWTYSQATGLLLDEADMTGATISGSTWTNVKAEGAASPQTGQPHNTTMNFNSVIAYGVWMQGCKFARAIWDNALFYGDGPTSGNHYGKGSTFLRCDFTSGRMRWADARSTAFLYCSMPSDSTAYTGMKAAGANFTGCTGMPTKAAFMSAVASYNSSTIWTDGLPITTTTASDTVNQVRKGAGTLATPDVVGGVKRFDGPILSDSHLDVAGNGFFSGRIKASGFANKVDSISYSESPYTVTTGQYTVLVNTAGGAVTVNLPLGSDDGTIIILRRIEGSNNVTVQTASYVMKVEGANTYTISSNTPVRFVKNGTKWWLM